MPELPRITDEQVIEALSHFGFSVVRIVGPLRILKKPNHPFLVTVPRRDGKRLKKGTILAVVKEAGLAVEEFAEQIR
jgi:predicted RNA binding protein YcfA (HicA-like mRNA interferase family)